MKGKVDVSVVIAVYNGERYIAETLDSLIHQNIQSWECWIVDDGSSDSTVLIVDGYCKRDSRFNLIRTQGGNGPYICANRAIPFCNGELIARIDADDIALPQRLSMQTQAFAEKPWVNACGSYYYYLHENGRLSIKTFETNSLFLKWQLLFRNRLVHSTMMFRKSWFLKVGMYPAKRLAQDWFLWVEAVRQDCLYVIPQPLIQWRIHASSITRNEKSSQLTHAAEVSKYAVGSLVGYEADVDCLRTIIAALHGRTAGEPTVVNRSLRELVQIWRSFLSTYSPSKVELRKLRNEFVYFGFYLLTVNHRFLNKWYNEMYYLCKTEVCATTFRWFLVFIKRRLHNV